jgi:hypothetical protein
VPSIRVARGVPVGSVPLLIVDNPDVANALGYHDVDPRGMPYGRVFVDPVLDNGGSALGDKGDPSLSVSAVLSHEVLEWWYDPACNDWADRGRTSVAKELCDPVEADWYRIDGVAVSNYVLPAWFNPLDKVGPFDRLGKLTKPVHDDQGRLLDRDGRRRCPPSVRGQLARRSPHRPQSGTRRTHPDPHANRTRREGRLIMYVGVGAIVIILIVVVIFVLLVR